MKATRSPISVSGELDRKYKRKAWQILCVFEVCWACVWNERRTGTCTCTFIFGTAAHHIAVESREQTKKISSFAHFPFCCMLLLQLLSFLHFTLLHWHCLLWATWLTLVEHTTIRIRRRQRHRRRLHKLLSFYLHKVEQGRLDHYCRILHTSIAFQQFYDCDYIVASPVYGISYTCQWHQCIGVCAFNVRHCNECIGLCAMCACVIEIFLLCYRLSFPIFNIALSVIPIGI